MMYEALGFVVLSLGSSELAACVVRSGWCHLVSYLWAWARQGRPSATMLVGGTR